ncbi:MAG: type II toxin-antitoxin system RelE/ParE family toxin, partial [Deltaproteobacteria bacterium]|nr:type II toxin-antitoxin system RelE/ParE family toxin [Deltaproteobacteria bacterium]
MSEQSFEVVWARNAAKDLQEIVGYIAENSPANARKVLERIKAKASALSRFPQRGRVVPQLASFGIHTYRELVIRPYLLVYRIYGGKVIVLAVLDSRRDLEDVLLERLVR